ncbi:L-type lectin-domain containing receptor kinase IX.1-like [Wolffia australiana]
MSASTTIVGALLISFILQTTGKLATTSFDFASFLPLPAFISFEGDGFAAGGSLELNKNKGYSYGRALYSSPIHLWDNKTGNVAEFSTRFSFSVFRRPDATRFADGLAFFLVPVRYGLPENTTGGELTLFNSYNASRPHRAPVVAVEFDTFLNEWDSEVPHVGIDVGFIQSEEKLAWDPFWGKDNFTATAEITYDPATTRLRASFAQGEGNNRELAVTVDLKAHLPENVTIGFAGGTGLFFERHVIKSWSFSSSLELPDEGGIPPIGSSPAPKSSPAETKSSVAAVVGGVAGAVALALIAAALAWFIVRRRRAAAASHGGRNGGGIDEKELDEGKGPNSFSYADLARATKNFATEEKLGRGGFGDVYKGNLGDPEMVVAIKRVAKDSHQGQKEYVAEVKVISRVRHRNLVKLVGWCHEKGELLLVYEFMPNGSLDAHLYGGGNPLPWPTRYNITKGVAAALLYLHEQWEQCVVHRDVKASNVMLDANFNAKLGDFGLARLVEHGSGMETTAVAGTMGYLAPETAMTGRASTESDVYSFGVLALEIACGRRPIEFLQKEGRFSLVEWVWDLYGRGSVLEAVDSKLDGEFDTGEMERLLVMGLWCAHPNYQERPTMAQVIGVLVFDMAVPNLPSQLPVPSYGGVSVTGVRLASLKGWSSSSTSGVTASVATGSSVDSDMMTPRKPDLR